MKDLVGALGHVTQRMAILIVGGSLICFTAASQQPRVYPRAVKMPQIPPRPSGSPQAVGYPSQGGYPPYYLPAQSQFYPPPQPSASLCGVPALSAAFWVPFAQSGTRCWVVDANGNSYLGLIQ